MKASKVADVVQILVKAGDEVQAEQSVVELETEKAVVEVPVPFAGKVDQGAHCRGRQPESRPNAADGRRIRRAGEKEVGKREKSQRRKASRRRGKRRSQAAGEQRKPKHAGGTNACRPARCRGSTAHKQSTRRRRSRHAAENRRPSRPAAGCRSRDPPARTHSRHRARATQGHRPARTHHARRRRPRRTMPAGRSPAAASQFPSCPIFARKAKSKMCRSPKSPRRRSRTSAARG